MYAPDGRRSARVHRAAQTLLHPVIWSRQRTVARVTHRINQARAHHEPLTLQVYRMDRGVSARGLSALRARVVRYSPVVLDRRRTNGKIQLTFFGSVENRVSYAAT